MRALLFALLLTTSASAQTSEVSRLDRQIATLNSEIVLLDLQIRDVQSEVGRYGARSSSLAMERRDYDARVADYRGRAYALQGRSAEVQDMYDDLVRYGGSDADFRAYDDARYALEADADRLTEDARDLDRMAADITRAGYDSAGRVHTAAEAGRDMNQRRSALRYERDRLVQRRDRLRARAPRAGTARATDPLHLGRATEGPGCATEAGEVSA